MIKRLLIKLVLSKETISAIKDCIKYCETKSVYDKLSKYNDFYYYLNKFIIDNKL